MKRPEYMVKNTNSGGCVLFFAHPTRKASYFADKFIERNKGKFPMELYERTLAPLPAPLWRLIKSIPVEEK